MKVRRDLAPGWRSYVVVCPDANAFATYWNLVLAILMKTSPEKVEAATFSASVEETLDRSGCSQFPAGTQMYASGLEGPLTMVTVKSGEGNGMVGVTYDRFGKSFDYDFDADVPTGQPRGAQPEVN